MWFLIPFVFMLSVLTALSKSCDVRSEVFVHYFTKSITINIGALILGLSLGLNQDIIIILLSILTLVDIIRQ